MYKFSQLESHKIEQIRVTNGANGPIGEKQIESIKKKGGTNVDDQRKSGRVWHNQETKNGVKWKERDKNPFSSSQSKKNKSIYKWSQSKSQGIKNQNKHIMWKSNNIK